MCADKTDIAHSVNRSSGLLFDRAMLPDAHAGMLKPTHWQAAPNAERGGRGAVWFVATPAADAVLRHYRRGGLVARFARDRYFWTGSENTRSFAEFRLLLQLREHSLPVPRPILAGYRRCWPLHYRADLLMEQIKQATSLAELMRAGAIDSSVLSALGITLARFHQVGVDHADLNAHNVLFDREGQWWVIDFDRGRLRQPDAHWPQQRLRRLQRSMRKLMDGDPTQADRWWQQLQQAHDAAAREHGWMGLI